MKRKRKITPKIKVVNVKEQRRRTDRRTIFLADGRVFGLPGDIFLAHPIHPGDHLDEHQINDLLDQSDQQKLWDSALNLLSYRARSRGELKQRLIQKNWDKSEVEPILDRLENKGYLDDLEFSRAFCRDKIKLKYLGPRVVSSELFRLHITATIIQQIITEYYPAGREIELIRKLLDKKNISMAGSDKKQQKKIIDFLMRKGYNWTEINTVIQSQNEAK